MICNKEQCFSTGYWRIKESMMVNGPRQNTAYAFKVAKCRLFQYKWHLAIPEM